jgi:ComF family protein
MSLDRLSYLGPLADLLCPERCGGCPALVPPLDLFCAICRTRVRQLGPPECGPCGCPLTPDGRCPECGGRPSPIRSARAWAAYHHPAGPSPVAQAIAAFKYGGARRLARRLAAIMASRVADTDVALVIPVPLHARRLRQRGYNQSALVARHLARRLGCTSGPTLVVRTRDTPSQTELAPAERVRNVAGAFVVRDPSAIRGRALLLIDDVWTSGATARALATVLRNAGAAAIDVLTIARVL